MTAVTALWLSLCVVVKLGARPFAPPCLSLLPPLRWFMVGGAAQSLCSLLPAKSRAVTQQNPYLMASESWKQCAAEMSQRLDTSEAPHTWP